jgi:serine/threonine protein kinase
LDDEADPTAPRLIAGRYELGALIGRGGAARVRRARAPVLERDVAVKILPTEAGTGDRDRRRSEAKLLASLNHPSLVTLYDAVATDEATFLVMELTAGSCSGS